MLKIAKDIPKGLTGREAQQQGAIVTANIPAEFKPVTAIVDPSIFQDKVAVANFATGQIIVDGMFADPIDNQITFSGRLPNDCIPLLPVARPSRVSASRSRSTRSRASPA